MSSGQQARLKDLEVQLLSARDSLAQAEHDRANHSSWTQRLGHELADARANEQEARLREAQQGQELRDAQRRLEQLVGGASTPGELARCQKRLAELEQVCSRQEAELAEERRARERCHLEAVKSGEKLRLARAQGAQMKERVKSLEEAELRYPSRFPPRSIKNLRLGSARSASLPAEPRARGTGHRAQGVPWEPRTAGRAERQVNEPVAKEARWSWEEQPRAALPQAEPQDSGLAAMLPKAATVFPDVPGDHNGEIIRLWNGQLLKRLWCIKSPGRRQHLRIRFACPVAWEEGGLQHVQCSRLHWDDVPLRLVRALDSLGAENGRLKLEELSSVVDRLQAREPPQHLRPGAEEMGIYESCVSGLPELKPKSNQEYGQACPPYEALPNALARVQFQDPTPPWILAEVDWRVQHTEMLNQKIEALEREKAMWEAKLRQLRGQTAGTSTRNKITQLHQPWTWPPGDAPEAEASAEISRHAWSRAPGAPQGSAREIFEKISHPQPLQSIAPPRSERQRLHDEAAQREVELQRARAREAEERVEEEQTRQLANREDLRAALQQELQALRRLEAKRLQQREEVRAKLQEELHRQLQEER
ncbi:Reticulocyte-binding protein 2 homolog a, partial [Durusdinium trenchii]